MHQFEALTEIHDIAEAREAMFSWYGHIPTDVLCAYLDALTLAPGAREASAQLHDAGATLAIASFTWEFAVATVARWLGIEYWIGTRRDAQGDFQHVWHDTKARWVTELADGLGIDREATAAVGDSGFDVEMLNAVATPVFVGRSVPPGLPSRTIHLPDADLRDVADRLFVVHG